MDLEYFKLVITAIIFAGGIKAIQAAVEWCKRLSVKELPKWSLALLPVFFGLLINVGGLWTLGYFQEFGRVAIAASIIIGVVAGFMAMGLYDDKQPVK